MVGQLGGDFGAVERRCELALADSPDECRSEREEAPLGTVLGARRPRLLCPSGPRRQPPRSAQRGAETKTAFGHVLFADQAKSAVDARVAIGQRGLVGRRIVPGESALSIWEANDCTIPESGIANKRRPATAGNKFSTMVFNRGTSGCGVSVLGSRVLYDQFNNNICTHNGLISIACGVRNTD